MNWLKFKEIIGINFVVASTLKLLCIWGIIHWSWLERPVSEPWATYFTPLLLILVGSSLIYDGYRQK